MKTEHPIRSLCEALEVSTSGYYDWSNRQTQPSPRAQENARLAQQIVQIPQDSRHTTAAHAFRRSWAKPTTLTAATALPV
jgi:putative transposase